MGRYFLRCRHCRAALLGVALTQGAAASVQAGEALPTGGQYVAGNGAIAGNGDTLSVTQAGQTGIIDWQSFSIGAGHTVTIDNGAGATLNRVTGADLSRIDGLLSATGSTYLINRNGIVIGPGGKVVTGGSFVGSTRDITNEDFLNGGADRFSGGGNGDVVNQGAIRAEGGDAVLIGRNVSNSGSVEAPEGTAAMAAGNDIVLQPVGGDRRIYIQGASGDGDVTNDGAVKAAQAELAAAQGNVYALAGNTDGVLRATGSETKDGRVLLTAGGGASVSGKVEAENADGAGGDVTVTAKTVDISGSVDVSAKAAGKNGGTIIAKASGKGIYTGTLKAKGGEGGAGGFVETSGHEVDYAGVQVDTSTENGKTGEWLIDPEDLVVDAAAASTISGNLASSNVTLQTTDTTASGTGYTVPSGEGDIIVMAPISWSSANTLTLDSYHSITIGANIAVSGAGGVVLETSNGGSGGDYGFGLTPSGFTGSIEFGPTDNGATLTINGQSYTLLYSVSQLDAIDGVSAVDGSAVTRVGSGNYAVATNLDASGTVYTYGLAIPDDNYSLDMTRFTGLGHEISNLYIDSPTSADVGLFGTTRRPIRDIGVSGTVRSAGGNVGGLVGRAQNSLQNVYSTVSVTNTDASPYDYTGGLAGQLWCTMGCRVKNAFATGAVEAFPASASAGTAGGLIGSVYMSGSISNSFATGAVTGPVIGGGLLGSLSAGFVSNSYATGAVQGAQAGGFVGDLVATTSSSTGISDSYATGAVTGYGAGASLSGFAGDVSGSIAISNLYWATDGTGQSNSGFSGTPTNVTGLTTAQLENSLPPGFDSTVWNGGSGVAPYLTALAAPTAPPVPPTNPISGTVYSSYGGSVLSGANVIEAHLGGGAVIDQTTSDGSGAYSVTSPGSNGKLLLFLDNSGGTYATTLVDYQGSALTGIDLYGGNLNVANVSAADISSVLSILSGNFAAPTGYAGNDFLFNVSGGTTTLTGGLIVNAPGAFTIDRALSFGGNDGLVLNVAGDIEISEAVSTAPTGTLRISTGGTITTGANGTVDVGTFKLPNGTWNQLGTSLPSFNADDFRFNATNATFIRALGGDGSSSAPYRFADVYGLQGMASESLLSENFILENDLDASGTAGWNNGKGFLPIGSDGTPTASYGGVADGQGHTITGLTINRPSSDHIGLFATIGSTTVDNFALVGGSVTGNSYVGGLAGRNNGHIGNSSANVAVTGNGFSSAGGLAGGNFGSITNSWATGDVDATGTRFVGGLVGGNLGSVSKSYATGNVRGGQNVGGLIGAGFGGSSVEKAFATGTVRGADFVGGLIGTNSDGAVTDAYATGDVTGTASNNTAGGLMGSNVLTSASVSNTYATGTVTGSNAGGLMGGSNVSGTGSVAASFWDKTSTGRNNGVGSGGSTGMTGLDADGMKALSNFSGAGWSIAGSGDSSAIWRIYPGQTAPLLRWALSPVTVTADDQSKVYDGAAFGGSYSYTSSAPGASLLGTLGSNLASVTDAGSYVIGGLYSDQFGYDIAYAAGTGTLTIDPRSITVTADDLHSTYGTANPSLTWQVTTGSLVTGDTLSGVLATTATAASDVGDYDVTQGTLAADSNYALSFNPGTLTVDPKTLALSLGYQTSKGYDGNTDATLTLSNYFGLGDVLSGDTVSLSNYTSGTYDNRNAGSGKTVTVSGLTLSGADAGNYQLASDTLSADIGTISRKALLPGLTGPVSKTYDGTADATLTLANYTGLDFVSGDDVTLSGYANGSYLNKNVGNYKPVGVSGLSLTGQDSGNYRLIVPYAQGGSIGAITPAQLTVTAKDDSKVYDGAAYSGGNGIIYSGFVGGEDDSVLTGTLAYAGDAQGAVNVGDYQIEVSGLSSSNYDISFAPGTLTISAAALDLSITPQAASKIYGDTLSLTQFDASGLVGSDAISGVTLTSPGTVATADAGSYDIAVSNAVFSSGSASNYAIHYHTLTDGLTVTPRAISVAADDLNRIYGAANPTLTWQLTNGNLVNGDTLSGALATAATTTSDVGGYVIAQGTLDAGSNYALTFNGGTLTIDPKTLTPSLTGTVDKTYDGTTDATLALANYSGLGFVSGDTVRLAGYAAGSYDTKDAGTGKKVSVSGLSLVGSDAGNYQLASADVSGNIGTIDHKSLTVTAENDRVTYDGTAYAGGNGVTYAGFVSGENATDLNGTLVYGGTAQGARDAGTYAITASGLVSANYAIDYAPGTLVIDPKTLTPALVGSVSKTYDGTADATLALANYTGLGFVAGDTVQLAGYAAGSYDTKDAGTGKKVAVSGLSLSGADAGNYRLTSVSAAGNIGVIDPKTLTLGLTGSIAKTYDGDTDATLALTNYVGLGFVAGDTVQLAGYAAGSYDTKDTGTGKKVSVSGLALSGSDAMNYRLASASVSGNIGAIDPASLTITPDDVEKNAGQSIVLSGYVVNGLVPGDAVTGVTLASSGTDSDAAAGSYDITASNATGTGLSNYDIAYLSGMLTVRRSIPSDESVRSITSHPMRMAWQASQSEIGPGVGTGGFWSLPLLVRAGFSGPIDTADIVTGSIRDEDDDPWNLLLGPAGRLNGRATIGVRFPHFYPGGPLSANMRQGR